MPAKAGRNITMILYDHFHQAASCARTEAVGCRRRRGETSLSPGDGVKITFTRGRGEDHFHPGDGVKITFTPGTG